MKIQLDLEANALLIKFRDEKASRTKEIDEDTIIDVDDSGNPIAIEMLNIIPRIPLENFSNVDVNIPVEVHKIK